MYDKHIDFHRTDAQNGITLMYFAITSLSTVGFGDYTPRSDQERLCGAFILLFGVAIFSYIMGIFIEILSTYNLLNADLDDGENLARFFGLLKYFNHNKPLDFKFKKRLEEYFDFKWCFDRNQATDDPDEQQIMD